MPDDTYQMRPPAFPIMDIHLLNNLHEMSNEPFPLGHTCCGYTASSKNPEHKHIIIEIRRFEKTSQGYDESMQEDIYTQRRVWWETSPGREDVQKKR